MLSNLIGVKLASALLMHKGELSLDDIAALPTVEDNEDVALIMSILLQRFNAEIQQRRIEPSAIPAWEEVISLRSERKLAATT